MFSSSIVMVSDGRFKPLIHFELIFVSVESQGSSIFLLHVDIPIFLAPFIEKTVFLTAFLNSLSLSSQILL
jgi:hypothetical protein